MEDHVWKGWGNIAQEGYPSRIGLISVSKHVGNLGDLPRMSNDKDKFQARTKKKIRI